MYVVTEIHVEEAQTGDEFREMMDKQIEEHEVTEKLLPEDLKMKIN